MGAGRALLIVAETRGRRLTAFDVEDDGSLANRRVWAELDMPPDGICLDSEGGGRPGETGPVHADRGGRQRP